MSVTAKDTRAALKTHVVPVLRANGFEDGTPSKLWRHKDKRIDHVEMACYSAYNASVLGCSTASFSVRIASSLDGYGALDDPFHKDHVKMGPKGPRPSEPQMPIRGVLCHDGAAALKKGIWGWEFDQVWRVETADDADRASRQVARHFEDYGLEWLGRRWDFNEILEVLDQPDTSPMLVTRPCGSHMRLYAESHGSQVRNAHKLMARRGARNSKSSI